MEFKSFKRPTSKDVAKVAGVSRATVSAYINKTRYVSPKLEEKIQSAINKLRYTPNELARSLKMQDTKTIGLIIPVLSDFFVPMLNIIDEILQKNNYSLLLSSSEEDGKRERKILEIFLSKQISGIIVVPSSEKNRMLIDQIMINGTPIVQVNRKIDKLDVDYIVSKNFDAIYKATEFLIKKGRKNIALLGYNVNVFGEREKKDGYEKAINDNNLNINTININGRNPESILESLDDFFSPDKKIDGIICTSQMRTTLSLKYLKDKSIKIPKDMSFIGYEDTSLAILHNPPLTVISENIKDMGEKSANLLLKRIKNKGMIRTKKILLDFNFFIRESC